tara:strand:- start:3516 stop:5900 length:2385 start_codon:yes stop_codon:yes gene_type:complete
MKNKLSISIFVFIFFSIILENSFASEDFVFESKSIELVDNGNIIKAKNGVEITTNDGLKIDSKKSTYSKVTKKLLLIDDVVVFDSKNNITIKSNYIEYDKILEIIVSKEKTLINIDNDFNIKTKNISFLKLKNIIQSNEKSILEDNYKNIVETNDFTYFIKDKQFRSKNLVITDKNMNKYFSNEAAINLNNNEIAAKDVQVYFSESSDFGKHARLKGNSMISSENSTIIKKGIFTTCKQTESCPPWTIQSDEIEHDKVKKNIIYKNAWINFYDKPVFYFPKFFHPDPTVKRQSGFLIPSITSSNNSGVSLNIPYFHAISDNRDFTLSPKIFFNNDLLLQNEYRQVEKNLNHISDFSLKKLDNSSKSHFFSNTKIFLDSSFENSDIEINLEKTSNDTYLKSENIKTSINDSQSVLNSYVNYTVNNDNLDFFAEIAAYEDLSQTENSDKYQFILPSFSLSKLIGTNKDIKGNLKYVLKGLNQKKNTNVSESYLINDLEYNSNLKILRNGVTNNFSLLLKNASKKGQNSSNYSDDFQSDNFISTIFTSSLPMKKTHNYFQSNLVPKASIRLSPFDSENISDLDRQLNTTNFFNSNRLGLLDSLEGGQSITLGFDYNVSDQQDNTLFSSSLGQIFRDTDDDKLPISSTMHNKRSDIIGKLEFKPYENFEINYDFSADNDLDTMNYNFLESKFTVNNFITSFEFLEENNDVGSNSYFQRDFKYKFNQKSSLNYTTRRNRKTDLTEYYNLIYEYKNDCLVAAIEYNKNYYEDRDIRPNEEIFFSITLTPLTSISSPNINK